MSYGDGEQPPVSETPEPKDDTSNPVFNLPSLLVGILAALIIAYVVPAYLLSEEGNGWFIFTFGFIPLRYAVPFFAAGAGMALDTGDLFFPAWRYRAHSL